MGNKDTSNDFSIPLWEREKPCDAPKCDGAASFRDYCGAWVCGKCDKHVGLARCYCGWSSTGPDGRAELVDMGEAIGDEYPDAWDENPPAEFRRTT